MVLCQSVAAGRAAVPQGHNWPRDAVCVAAKPGSACVCVTTCTMIYFCRVNDAADFLKYRSLLIFTHLGF